MTSCVRQGKRAKVILSNITNVYKNLALEHWILNNWSFNKFDCLLIYRNSPCVVVGRFQNVWREVNVKKVISEGVDIARRVSGGGTVYHDLGNVNFSFFTDKPSHCPSRNLTFLSQTLNDRYGLEIDLNERHDLFIGQNKISGSASRIIRTGSFHHCTLLVNSDLTTLSGILRGDTSITSVATASLPSPTTSLHAVLSRDVMTRQRDVITPSSIIDHVAEEFLGLYFDSFPAEVDTWDEECSQDTEKNVILVEDIPGNISEPHHQSFDWIFGKTPKFTKQFGKVRLTVEKGLVDEIEGFDQHEIIGKRYDPDEIAKILQKVNP